MNEDESSGWRKRRDNYEKILNQMDNPSSHLLQRLSIDLFSYLSDVNPNCQKIALAICASFLSKKPYISYSQLTQILINKCLTSNKQVNIDLASSQILTCLLQSHEGIYSILLDNLNAKSPKVVVSLLKILSQDLQTGIPKDASQISQLSKKVSNLSENRDPTIRKEAQSLLSLIKVASQQLSTHTSPNIRPHTSIPHSSKSSNSQLSRFNSTSKSEYNNSLHNNSSNGTNSKYQYNSKPNNAYENFNQYSKSPRNSPNPVIISSKQPTNRKRQASSYGFSSTWYLVVPQAIRAHLQSSLWQDILKGLSETKNFFYEEPGAAAIAAYGIASIFKGKTYPPKVMQEIFDSLEFFSLQMNMSENQAKAALNKSHSFPSLNEEGANAIILFLIDKQFGKGYEKQCFSILDSISQSLSPSFVVQALLPYLSAKNPILPAKILPYLQHNPADLQVLIPKVRDLLSHPDGHVRAAADSCLYALADASVNEMHQNRLNSLYLSQNSKNSFQSDEELYYSNSKPNNSSSSSSITQNTKLMKSSPAKNLNSSNIIKNKNLKNEYQKEMQFHSPSQLHNLKRNSHNIGTNQRKENSSKMNNFLSFSDDDYNDNSPIVNNNEHFILSMDEDEEISDIENEKGGQNYLMDDKTLIKNDNDRAGLNNSELIQAQRILNSINNKQNTNNNESLNFDDERINNNPSNESLIQASLINEFLINENLINNNLNDDSLNDESLNDESVNNESINSENINNEIQNIHDITNESISNEQLNPENLNNNIKYDEAINNENLNNDKNNVSNTLNNSNNSHIIIKRTKKIKKNRGENKNLRKTRKSNSPSEKLNNNNEQILNQTNTSLGQNNSNPVETDQENGNTNTSSEQTHILSEEINNNNNSMPVNSISQNINSKEDELNTNKDSKNIETKENKDEIQIKSEDSNTNQVKTSINNEEINTTNEEIHSNNEDITMNNQKSNITKELKNTDIEETNSNKEEKKLNKEAINTNNEGRDTSEEKTDTTKKGINPNQEEIKLKKEEITSTKEEINTNKDEIQSQKVEFNAKNEEVIKDEPKTNQEQTIIDQQNSEQSKSNQEQVIQNSIKEEPVSVEIPENQKEKNLNQLSTNSETPNNSDQPKNNQLFNKDKSSSNNEGITINNNKVNQDQDSSTSKEKMTTNKEKGNNEQPKITITKGKNDKSPIKKQSPTNDEISNNNSTNSKIISEIKTSPNNEPKNSENPKSNSQNPNINTSKEKSTIPKEITMNAKIQTPPEIEDDSFFTIPKPNFTYTEDIDLESTLDDNSIHLNLDVDEEPRYEPQYINKSSSVSQKSNLQPRISYKYVKASSSFENKAKDQSASEIYKKKPVKVIQRTTKKIITKKVDKSIPKPQENININMNQNSSMNMNSNINMNNGMKTNSIPKISEKRSLFLKEPTAIHQAIREKKEDPHLALKLLNGDEVASQHLIYYIDNYASKYFLFFQKFQIYNNEEEENQFNEDQVSQIGELFLQTMDSDFNGFLNVLDIILMWWTYISLSAETETVFDILFAFLQTIFSRLFDASKQFDQFEIASILPTILECAGRNLPQSQETLDSLILLSPQRIILTEFSYIISNVTSTHVLTASFNFLFSFFVPEKTLSFTQQDLHLSHPNPPTREPFSSIPLSPTSNYSQISEISNLSNENMKYLKNEDGEVTELAHSLRRGTLKILSNTPKDSELYSSVSKFEQFLSMNMAILELNSTISEDLKSNHFLIYKWISDIGSSLTPDSVLLEALQGLFTELNKEQKLIDTDLFAPHLHILLFVLISAMHSKYPLFDPSDKQSQRICKYITWIILILLATFNPKTLPDSYFDQLIMELITYITSPIITQLLKEILNALLIKLISDFTANTFISLLKIALKFQKYSSKWGKFATKCLGTCGSKLFEIGSEDEINSVITAADKISKEFFETEKVEKLKETSSGRRLFKFFNDFVKSVGQNRIQDKYLHIFLNSDFSNKVNNINTSPIQNETNNKVQNEDLQNIGNEGALDDNQKEN